jgi:hypothetical protein
MVIGMLDVLCGVDDFEALFGEQNQSLPRHTGSPPPIPFAVFQRLDDVNYHFNASSGLVAEASADAPGFCPNIAQNVARHWSGRCTWS